MKRSKPLKRTGGLKRTPFKPKRKSDSGWQKVRKQALARAHDRCEAQWSNCQGHAAHVHHIKRRSQGGDNSLNNLLVCCHVCHGDIHANPAEAMRRNHLHGNTHLTD